MFFIVWFLICTSFSNIVIFSNISCIRIYAITSACARAIGESISFSTYILSEEFVRPLSLGKSEGLLVQNTDKSSSVTTLQRKSLQNTRARWPDRGNKTRPRENNLARKFRFASNYFVLGSWSRGKRTPVNFLAGIHIRHVKSYRTLLLRSFTYDRYIRYIAISANFYLDIFSSIKTTYQNWKRLLSRKNNVFIFCIARERINF